MAKKRHTPNSLSNIQEHARRERQRHGEVENVYEPVARTIHSTSPTIRHHTIDWGEINMDRLDIMREELHIRLRMEWTARTFQGRMRQQVCPELTAFSVDIDPESPDLNDPANREYILED